MGDKFWLQIKCGGCGEKNPSDKDYSDDPLENGCYFAPNSGFMDFTCRVCGKKNWIENTYSGRVVSKKELTELYKKNGFEDFQE